MMDTYTSNKAHTRILNPQTDRPNCLFLFFSFQGNSGPSGLKGSRGPPGEQGIPGIPGPQGNRGGPGLVVSCMHGTANWILTIYETEHAFY